MTTTIYRDGLFLELCHELGYGIFASKDADREIGSIIYPGPSDLCGNSDVKRMLEEIPWRIIEKTSEREAKVFISRLGLGFPSGAVTYYRIETCD